MESVRGQTGPALLTVQVWPLSPSPVITNESLMIERTYLVDNTCYYGLTRQDCEREDFVNISCCSLSVRSLPQQWSCGETEQSVKEPCGGECPRSSEQGYYISSKLLEDYVLCQGNTILTYTV